MITCDVCGEEHINKRNMNCHMRSHAHDHVKLTDIQRQVILGSLLGDMSILLGRGYRNPKVSASQSTKQTEYLMWKYDILKNLTAGSKPHTYAQSSDFGQGSNKTNYIIRFMTMQLPCLLPIYGLVRGGGKKYVSKSWLDEITDPIGLAVWYMDDGCLANRCNIRFALGLVSPEECFTIQNWMLNKWDIVSTIFNQTSPIPKYSHNIYSNLSIGSKSNLRKFKELVEPHIIPSMRYKIDKLSYLS